MSLVSDNINKIIAAGGLMEKFVNGTKDDIVQTTAGPIRTLSGIADTAIDNIMKLLTASSNTSITAGTGAKSFVIGAGKGFKTGQFVSASAGDIVLSGPVTAYINDTLVVNVVNVIGTGTATLWAINFTGSPGKDGAGTGGGTSSDVKEVLVNCDPATGVDPNDIDANKGNVFLFVISTKVTLPDIKNAVPGKTYTFVVKQDTQGNHTLAYGKHYKFAGGAFPSASTSAQMVDIVEATYSSLGFYFCKFWKGFTVTPIAQIGDTQYDTMQAAANAAVDGDTTWVLRTGQLGEVNSAWDGKDGFFEIAGIAGTSLPNLATDINTRLAYGKAVIDPEQGSFLIRDLEISGAAISPDDNGAAIRYNPAVPKLRMERLYLTNNQNGILAAVPNAACTPAEGQYNIEIVDCNFDANGVAPSGLTHNIYLNELNRVSVLRSRFTNAKYGHDFKNRAHFVLLDRTYHRGSAGGRELDVPNGGIVHAVNSYFIKNADAIQNNLIGIGQEGIMARPQEYIFRNCLLQNDRASNFALTWLNQPLSSIPVKFVDCVFLGGSSNCIVGPFELYYTGGPIGPEGWDQSIRGVIPKQAAQTGVADSYPLLPDDQQPKPVFGPDPTLGVFPPTGSTSIPTTRPPGGPVLGTDTTAPTVWLAVAAGSPPSSKVVTLTATASDNVKVVKVEIYHDTTLIKTLTQVPFVTTENFTVADNGTTINYSAKAYDAAGNAGTSNIVPVTINIVPDTTSPLVDLSASTTSVIQASTVTFTATATDNVGVTQVEIKRGGATLATLTQAPYTLVQNYTYLDNGDLVYSATAYDADGNAGTTTDLHVSVAIPVPHPHPSVTLDAASQSEYDAAVSAAAPGSKRMAGATALLNALKPDHRLYVYQDGYVIVPVEYTGDCVIVDDGYDIYLQPSATIDSSDPKTSADLTVGSWWFELQGGTNYNRFYSGSVGNDASGADLKFAENPTPGQGINPILKIVMPRSLDGLN